MTRIRLVYPKPEQEIYEDSTFVLGSIQDVMARAKDVASGKNTPEWRLLLNGQPIPLSLQGFFAWKINLHPGMNPIKLQVFAEGGAQPLAQELFALYRVPAYEPLPPLPLDIVDETILPAEDVWLSDEDTLTVACLASVNAQISVTIPGVLDVPVPLKPLEKHGAEPGAYLDTRETIFAERHWTKKRIPLRGYYQAKLRMPTAGIPLHDVPIVFHLHNGKHALQHIAPGRLSLLQTPRVALLESETKADVDIITRTSPVSGARLTPQKAGTAVWIDGLKQGWARVRLNRDEAFYVPLEALAFPPDVTVIKPAALDLIRTEACGPNVSMVTLSISGQTVGACPILIEPIPQGDGVHRLQVRLYGLRSHCDFIHYPPDEHVIRQIHWRQVAENVVELWLDLHRPLAGYDYVLSNGQWEFTVKTLPPHITDTVVLIDPGHGGIETGATGLNGLYEKDLNLTIGELLKQALQAEGFQVAMTREADEELSLQSRQQKTMDQHADIVLSIHHNALPDGRDPLKAEGVCCFYYQPFSKNLAETILTGLVHPLPHPAESTETTGYGILPNDGLFYDSLFMTRIHQATSVLVEIGFFTNPAEFERLITPAFQLEAAKRLAYSVKQYCLSQSKPI